jgi:hypothetical protein
MFAVARVAWFRFGTTLRRRWAGYLAIVLLIGLVCGMGIGAIAGARRTQSAFPAYLERSDASDLQVVVIPRSPTSAETYSAALTATLARLPHVRRVAAFPFIFVAPMNGRAPTFPPALNNNEVSTIGTVNGEYFTQDRVAVVQGRMANPKNADEFVMTAEAASLLHWHVGQVVPLGVFTSQQSNLPGFGTARVQPVYRVTGRLVGIVMFASQVVRDEADKFPTFMLFTPAFTNRVLANASYFPTYALSLDDGSRDITAVEQEVINHVPKGYATSFHLTSVVEGQAERATKPESIALGVFGLIALLAGLLIAAQAISRQQQSSRDDLETMRGLGASQAMSVADALPGIGGSIVVGSLLATAIAVALSTITLVGPIRQIERSPGISFDWTVLGAGLFLLIFALLTFAVVNAFRNAPQRTRARRNGPSVSAVSRVAGAAAATGMSPTAVTGLRFALERGRRDRAAPVRSALLGTVLAVVVVVATLTFASGLHRLVSHPRLYGWNWSYAIEEAGSGKFPPVGQTLLSHDADVASWTGFNYADIQINGQTIPTLLAQPNSAVAPSMLSGHPIRTNNQIVLGAATLAQLRKHIGDTVTASFGGHSSGAGAYVPPTRLQVVGTATLPAIGNQGTLHASMGTGAIISNNLGPAAFKKAGTNPDPLQNGVRIAVVQLRATVSPAAGVASLRHIATHVTKLIAADKNLGGGTFDVLPVQQPAEIVSYQHTGNTPAALAAGLAAGAVVALALTLAASVRRRRHDLALLKAIGFTKRQLLATVAWQGSVAAIVGLVIGTPIGIAAGQWLWTRFARDIYAIPQNTVPWPQLALVALTTLVLANLAALIPGRTAARTPTALLLKSE